MLFMNRRKFNWLVLAGFLVCVIAFLSFFFFFVKPAAAMQATSSPQNPPANPAVTATPGSPKLEDVEERRGPFTLGGQVFTAALHYKRLLGKTGPDAQALESLDILNAAGAVQHHETFSFSLEKGVFSEDCSVEIQ